MKQLLAFSDGHVILGLNDRVFLGRLDQEQVVYELEPPSGRHSVATVSDNNDSNNGISSSLVVQAVAVMQYEEKLYVAVTRYDKSLCVYEIVETCAAAGENPSTSTTHTRLKPIAVHKTTKRAGSLCFATVNPPNNTGNSNSLDGDGENLPIVVSGDLAGDAVAFSIAVSTFDVKKKEETNSKQDDDGDEPEENNKHRRLLLGHTASMLTGLRVVQDGASARILTSDRDEKIRVSAFPNAFIIEGFLLGHEAFVSSMDVASMNGVTRCATCSGDGTVRVWDYSTCRELSSLTVSEGADLVPSRIAMSPDGSKIFALFDESRRIDVLDCLPDGLRSCASFECGSNALAVAVPDNQRVLVLVTAPPYLEAYRLNSDDKSRQVTAETCSYPFGDALRKITETATITMPTTILEKDKSGQLKMNKISENRGPAQEMPWNNSKRIETARNRNKRRRKRQQEQYEAKDDSP